MNPQHNEANSSGFGSGSSSSWGNSRPPVSSVQRYPVGSPHFSPGPHALTQPSQSSSLRPDPLNPHWPNSNLYGHENALSIEAEKNYFTPDEMERISKDSDLKEIAVSDPKQARRILKNRASATRSLKEKQRCIAELKVNVRNLEEKSALMSSKISILEEKLEMLMNDNTELKNQVGETTCLIRSILGEQMQNLDQSNLNISNQPNNIDPFNEQQQANHLDQIGISSMQSTNPNMSNQANIDPLDYQQQINPDFFDPVYTSNMSLMNSDMFYIDPLYDLQQTSTDDFEYPYASY